MGICMAYTILIADDEAEIRDILHLYLEQAGFHVVEAADGLETLSLLEKEAPDLLLLDIMMPKLDGYRVLKTLRENSNIPVIILSAKGDDSDKILGLDMGADDYITKPFNPLELMARVKTQLRRFTRYNQADSDVRELEEIDVRGLHISKKSHKCKLNGKELTLTPIEFDILWYLCEHRGSVVSSEELFEAVWKEQYLDNNNTVMALSLIHISEPTRPY